MARPRRPQAPRSSRPTQGRSTLNSTQRSRQINSGRNHSAQAAKVEDARAEKEHYQTTRHGGKKKTKEKTKSSRAVKDVKTSSQTLPSLSAKLAEKKRTQRRRRIWRWTISVVVLSIIAVVVWVVAFSSVLAIQKIKVKGSFQRLDAAEVTKDLESLKGTSLAIVRESSVKPNIKNNEWIKDVLLLRSFPHELEVRITERIPIAYVQAGEAKRMLDDEGHGLPVIGDDSLPVINVPEIDRDFYIVGLDVLKQLDPEMKVQLKDITVSNTKLIDIHLTTGQLIKWGDNSDGELKMKVVRTLNQYPPQMIDVSDPAQPVTM